MHQYNAERRLISTNVESVDPHALHKKSQENVGKWL